MENSPRYEFVASLDVTIAPALLVGQVGAGLREVIPITGGVCRGPALNGVVLPVGADWCLTRSDGISEVSARYLVQTDDGILISVLNVGLVQPDANGDFTGRTVPQFEVADGPYAWMRESIFIGTLLTDAAGTLAKISVYRVI